MEEIRIYHSIWRNIPLLAVCFVFAATGVLMLLDGYRSFIAWISILFFGGGGLFVLFLILRERICDKAYYIITDKSVLVDGMKKWEVRFADVEKFHLINVASSKQVGIRYKKGVELEKMGNAGRAGRILRKINSRIAGVPESLPVDGLSISPEELCDLLNTRLTK